MARERTAGIESRMRVVRAAAVLAVLHGASACDRITELGRIADDGYHNLGEYSHLGALGDVDGDGHDDFYLAFGRSVRDSKGSGGLLVVGGRDLQPLLDLRASGVDAPGRDGCAPLGDVDGDGVDDFALTRLVWGDGPREDELRLEVRSIAGTIAERTVAATDWRDETFAVDVLAPSGRRFLVRPRDDELALVDPLDGETVARIEGSLGEACRAVGGEWIVLGAFVSSPEDQQRQVEVLSAADRRPSCTLRAEPNDVVFGRDVAVGRDLDGDGRDDLAILAKDHCDEPSARLYDARTGRRILPDFDVSALGARALFAVALVPDQDGDGRAELVLAGRFDPQGAEESRAAVVSVSEGRVLRWHDAPRDLAIRDVRALGDTDGGGLDDYALAWVEREERALRLVVAVVSSETGEERGRASILRDRR